MDEVGLETIGGLGCLLNVWAGGGGGWVEGEERLEGHKKKRDLQDIDVW